MSLSLLTKNEGLTRTQGVLISDLWIGPSNGQSHNDNGCNSTLMVIMRCRSSLVIMPFISSGDNTKPTVCQSHVASSMLSLSPLGRRAP